jgi:transcription antitermination factor NusA-like protein
MSRRDGSQFSSYLVKGPVHARLTLPDKVAGSVIGRGGQVLQEFEQASGAQIKVSPSKVYFPSTNERTIIISGEDHQVKMGLSFIVRKLVEHHQDSRSLLLRLIVPNGSIPSIIGKGGEVVRSMQSRTGASMHLCERIDGIAETIFEVKGSDKNVTDAASEIIDIIQGDPKLKEIAGEYYASFQPSSRPPQRNDWQETYSRREDHRDGYQRRDERQEQHRDDWQDSYNRRDERQDSRQDSYQRRDDRQDSYHRKDDRQEPYQRREERPEPPYQRQEEYRQDSYQRYERKEAYGQQRETYPPRQYVPQPQMSQMTDPTTNPDLLAYPIAIEFVVPMSSVDYILGENGSHVEHVFNSTGAEVHISGQSDPNSVDVTVRITGPLCGVQAAHILVIKQVADALMAEDTAT